MPTLIIVFCTLAFAVLVISFLLADDLPRPPGYCARHDVVYQGDDCPQCVAEGVPARVAAAFPEAANA